MVQRQIQSWLHALLSRTDTHRVCSKHTDVVKHFNSRGTHRDVHCFVNDISHALVTSAKVNSLSMSHTHKSFIWAVKRTAKCCFSSHKAAINPLCLWHLTDWCYNKAGACVDVCVTALIWKDSSFYRWWMYSKRRNSLKWKLYCANCLVKVMPVLWVLIQVICSNKL